MIRRLAHLCINTDNLPAMLEFYSKVLGLPVKFAFRNSDNQIFGYYLDCGDSTFIEIFDRAGKIKQWGGTMEDAKRGTRFDHFCLEVTGLRDLKVELEKRGAKIGEIKTGMDHSFQMWTADPDGNPFELMEYTHHSLQLQQHPADAK